MFAPIGKSQCGYGRARSAGPRKSNLDLAQMTCKIGWSRRSRRRPWSTTATCLPHRSGICVRRNFERCCRALLLGRDVCLRRNLALLLLAVMISPIVALLLASSPESNLPACCRRNGKHHCAIMSPEPERSSRPSLYACRCPEYPNLSFLSGSRLVYFALSRNASFSPPVPRPTIALSARSFDVERFSRSSQKRGPPTVLS